MEAVMTDFNLKGARVTWGYCYHTDTFFKEYEILNNVIKGYL